MAQFLTDYTYCDPNWIFELMYSIGKLQVIRFKMTAVKIVVGFRVIAPKLSVLKSIDFEYDCLETDWI